MRHETERLWALAADELPLEDLRYVQLHLDDCPECRDALEAVHLARRTLNAARGSTPAVVWGPTDAKVGALVEKRLRAVSRPRWVPALTGALLVAAAGVVAVVAWPGPGPVEVPPTQPPLVEVVVPRPARVEMARGLTRVAANLEPVASGMTLGTGDVLKTGVAGKAFVRLPDASHLRLSAATQVALTRAEERDIALTVSRGRVAVRASHQSRQSFVVHAGDVVIQVMGTIFSVSNEPEGVEVAVSEGAVQVVAGESRRLEVRAGQRLFVDGRTGRARTGRLTPVIEQELGEVQGLAEAVTSAEQQAVVAAPGGSAPGRVSALPRLSVEEARARVVEPLEGATAPLPGASPPPSPVAAPAAPPQGVVTAAAPGEPERWEGPGTLFPSLAGGAFRGVPAFRDEGASAPAPQRSAPAPEGPTSEEGDWAALPKPGAEVAGPKLNDEHEPQKAAPLVTEVAPASAEKAPSPVEKAAAPGEKASAQKPQPRSLEQLFLEKAEASLEKGGCERFLAGLEDIALDGTEPAQVARVLRARCYETALRPRQAMAEYAKYLEAFPKGRFADEARAALGR
ncbi:MAG: FecR domain-containing protein [Myxococcaceae bacterium]|jgi:hypothetical protein|nr:FecR domain-containing protein [Myxococcaceae bacterium]